MNHRATEMHRENHSGAPSLAETGFQPIQKNLCVGGGRLCVSVALWYSEKTPNKVRLK